MEDAQGFLGHPEVGFGFIRTLVAAIIGAILILFIWHRVPHRA